MKPFITTERNTNILIAGAECILLPPKGNKPPCAVGDVLAVQESLWISDDGQFYAMHSVGKRMGGEFDAVTVDGHDWFFWHRYNDDPVTTPRYTCTHYVKHISGFHNLGRRIRPSKRHPNGRFELAFRLYLDDGDGHKFEPEFHHRIPAKDMPDWAHRCTLTVQKVESLNIGTQFREITTGTPMSAMVAWGDGDGLVDPRLGSLWRIWFKNVTADPATYKGVVVNE